MPEKIKLGISACLLGQNVRWDGGNSLDPFLTATMGRFVDWVPVCPEAECGLGIPRETIRLVGDPDKPRLLTSRTGKDLTERMLAWARAKMEELEKERLWGFVFKSKSPSSGMTGVKVFDPQGGFRRIGVGLFARTFMERFPLVPVEDENRLSDPEIRENFIDRIFTLADWRQTLAGECNPGSLVDFHTRNKFLILSHSEKHYRAMGRLVADQNQYPLQQVFDQYGKLLIAALALRTTAAKNHNVLLHAAGYFKKHLDRNAKAELLGLLDSYRRGDIPLIIPKTLINHYARRYNLPYLQSQTYLNPHPTALCLQNHA